MPPSRNAAFRPPMPAPGPIHLPTAVVDFDGDRPVSRAFNDIYYDADGSREVDRVFLAPANFHRRTEDAAGTFTVGELGFGTGLNFLVAASAARGRLHFVSFERHPLRRVDLARALAPWRVEFPLANLLVDNYPPPVAGWHRRHFLAGRIQLSVYYGDVRDGLEDLARQQRRGIDAWFLDGFAPRRNPAMWRPELFRIMATLSAPGASVTTFSAAGQVRRDLRAAGFNCERVDQRPRKRHSTVGWFAGRGVDFRPPSQATVLGAGLAGTATARALAEKGIAVTVVDPEGIATGASGIPAAVLHPRLSPTASAQAMFRLHAYAFAAHRCRDWPGVTQGGVVQLAGPTTDAERLLRVAEITPSEIAMLHDSISAEFAGLAINEPGLFFPGALTVDGQRIARAFRDHERIELAATCPTSPSCLVRATGPDTGGNNTLEVAAVGGQIDRFPDADGLRLPVVGDGTVVPAGADAWVGSTYEYRPWTPTEATSANAERYARLFGRPPRDSLGYFRGVRAVTSDRLPVIGEDDGVHFNLGHGSHGATTAVFGAELVASAIAGEVAPATLDILRLLRPGRFRERQTRRPNPFAKRT